MQLDLLSRAIKERIRMSLNGTETCFTSQGERLSYVLRLAGRPLHERTTHHHRTKLAGRKA